MYLHACHVYFHKYPQIYQNIENPCRKTLLNSTKTKSILKYSLFICVSIKNLNFYKDYDSDIQKREYHKIYCFQFNIYKEKVDNLASI